MKKYLIFAGSYYYPDGGWNDFKGYTDTLAEAQLKCINLASYGHTWIHVIEDQGDGNYANVWDWHQGQMPIKESQL